MKAKKILILAGLSLITMSNSCDTESQNAETPTPCTPATVTVMSVPGLVVGPDCLLGTSLEIGKSNSQVITSSAQLQATFSCSDLPPVDFETSTLLTGQTRLAYSGRVVSQQVVQSCKSYKYLVTIQQGLSTVLSTVTYHALVPKMANDATVELEVQILP